MDCTRTSFDKRAPSRWRSVLASGVFVAWGLGVGVLMLDWSREACDTMATVRERPEPDAGAAEGWRVRHRLPAGHALTERIGEQLIARGPAVGVREEITLAGRGARLLEERLRRAGWAVVRTEESAAETEPFIEIDSPDAETRWRGGFLSRELEAEGALVLDDVVLRRLARGEAVTPFVPVGCATRLGADARVATTIFQK